MIYKLEIYTLFKINLSPIISTSNCLSTETYDSQFSALKCPTAKYRHIGDFCLMLNIWTIEIVFILVWNDKYLNSVRYLY